MPGVARRLPDGAAGDIAWLALFAAGYALFDGLPVVLSGDSFIADMSWGDLVDAPLVFLPVALYVALGRRFDLWRSDRLRLLGGAALVLLVQGQGVHLAANTIAGVSDRSQQSWPITDFLDEHWGHVEVHGASILLALLLLVAGRATGDLRGASASARLVLFAATAVYGLFLAADAIEGQTAPLILPAGAILGAVAVRVSRAGLAAHRVFLGGAYGLAVVLRAVYGLVTGGFPELPGL